MKTWAFYKHNGNWHKIGVRAAVAREKDEPGQWRTKTYYSTHSPPSVRLKMHIRRSPKGKLLFAYNRGQEDEAERLGGGESLEHYLYKIAISELTSTSIKYGKDKKIIPIQITSSDVEPKPNSVVQDALQESQRGDNGDRPAIQQHSGSSI